MNRFWPLLITVFLLFLSLTNKTAAKECSYNQERKNCTIISITSTDLDLYCGVEGNCTSYAGRRFVFVQNNVADANEAKKLCECNGGKLASLNSKTIHETLGKISRQLPVKRYFIGGRLNVSEGTWKWETGEVFYNRSLNEWNKDPGINDDSGKYVAWSYNQPNEYPENENCCYQTELYFRANTSRNEWQDFACDYRDENNSVGYICEYNDVSEYISNILQNNQSTRDSLSKVEEILREIASEGEGEYRETGGVSVVVVKLNQTEDSGEGNGVFATIDETTVQYVSLPSDIAVANEDIFVSVATLPLDKTVFEKISPPPNTVKHSLTPRSTADVFTGSVPAILITAYTNASRINVKTAFSVDVKRDVFIQTLKNQNITTLMQHNNLLERYPSLMERKYVENASYKCAFFNPKTNRTSDDGCRLSSYIVGSTVTCECDHTTIFVVLLSVTTIVVPSSVKIVSFITEILSVLFLLVTLFILLKVKKKIRGNRISVQISLTVSLLLLHISTLLHDLALLHNTACEVITVLTHYFMLTTAMWMLMEGLTMLIKTTSWAMTLLSSTKSRIVTIMKHVSSWAFPAIFVIVGASVGLSKGSYMAINPVYTEIKARNTTGISEIAKYQFCWINPKSLDIFVLFVIGPIAVILLLNLAIVVRTAFLVYRMSLESENYRPTDQKESKQVHITATLKGIALLMPILGTPWLLGFLTGIGNASVVFMYVNALLNGLQGVFLFIVYCVLGKVVRKEIKRLKCVQAWKKYSPNPHSYVHSPRTVPTNADILTSGI